jgi:hypothetical protein
MVRDAVGISWVFRMDRADISGMGPRTSVPIKVAFVPLGAGIMIVVITTIAKHNSKREIPRIIAIHSVRTPSRT